MTVCVFYERMGFKWASDTMPGFGIERSQPYEKVL
jgi:hypothetical protein